MKSKLYILALLTLLTCGLCMALPSVRHAAAELITLAVSRGSSTASLTAISATPTAVRPKNLGLGSIVTITPITTGANGERCAVLFKNTFVVDLKIPANDDLCKVRVQWYLAGHPKLQVLIVFAEFRSGGRPGAMRHRFADFFAELTSSLRAKRPSDSCRILSKS